MTTKNQFQQFTRTIKRAQRRFAEWRDVSLADMQLEYARLLNLTAELVGVDTPAMQRDRVAMESTAQGYRENTPELYGQSLRQVRQKYAGDVRDYKPSLAGPDCNPELSETESALVQTSGHNQDVTQ